MTSQKSSVNVFGFTFWNAVKKHCVLPILSLVFFIIVYPGFTCSEIWRYIKVNNAKYTLAYSYNYILTSESSMMNDGLNYLITFSILLIGILMGTLMFSFITKKKTVNVYYSLGIKRSKLFSATYFAGAAMMFLAVLIPMLIDFFINIKYFGYTTQLSKSILYLTISIFTFFLLSFTITSLVMSVTGTAIEGAVYSAVFIISPQIIAYCIQWVMNFFLFGSQYNVAGNFIGGNSELYSGISLVKDFSFLIPSALLSNIINNYAMLTDDNYINSGGSGYFVNLIKWSTPNYTSILCWLLFTVILYVLTVYLFNRRKAEIAGFLNANKHVSSIATFLIGFSLSCAVMYILNYNKVSSKYTLFIVSLLAFAVFYIIFYAVLLRDLKKFKRELIKLPVHLALTFIIFISFTSGLFGYSSKVPDVEDIKSVEMTIPAGYLTMSDSTTYSEYYNYNLSNLFDTVKNFKSEDEKRLITSIHRKIINDGWRKVDSKKFPTSTDDAVYGNVYIKYTLKNGHTVTRFYDSVRISTMIDLLKIENTDNYKNQIKELFTKPISKNDSEKISGLKSLIQESSCNIILNSKYLNNEEPIKLSDKSKKELLNCLATDLSEQSYKERYFPENASIGVISFATDPKNWDYMNFLSTLANSPEIPSYNVILTEDMTNTISFLRSNNLMGYFEKSCKVTSAEVISYKAYQSSTYKYNEYYAFQFFASNFSKEYYEESINNSSDSSRFNNYSYKITNADIISSLEKVSYLSYYITYDGYLVRYTLDNGDKLTMYIPQSLMPQQVKDGVSKIKIHDIH